MRNDAAAHIEHATHLRFKFKFINSGLGLLAPCFVLLMLHRSLNIVKLYRFVSNLFSAIQVIGRLTLNKIEKEIFINFILC